MRITNDWVEITGFISGQGVSNNGDYTILLNTTASDTNATVLMEGDKSVWNEATLFAKTKDPQAVSDLSFANFSNASTVGGGGLRTSVLYTEQVLSEAQKDQVKENIDGFSITAIYNDEASLLADQASQHEQDILQYTDDDGVVTHVRLISNDTKTGSIDDYALFAIGYLKTDGVIRTDIDYTFTNLAVGVENALPLTNAVTRIAAVSDPPEGRELADFFDTTANTIIENRVFKQVHLYRVNLSVNSDDLTSGQSEIRGILRNESPNSTFELTVSAGIDKSEYAAGEIVRVTLNFITIADFLSIPNDDDPNANGYNLYFRSSGNIPNVTIDTITIVPIYKSVSKNVTLDHDNISRAISGDAGNDLQLGSDSKLFVSTSGQPGVKNIGFVRHNVNQAFNVDSNNTRLQINQNVALSDFDFTDAESLDGTAFTVDKMFNTSTFEYNHYDGTNNVICNWTIVYSISAPTNESGLVNARLEVKDDPLSIENIAQDEITYDVGTTTPQLVQRTLSFTTGTNNGRIPFSLYYNSSSGAGNLGNVAIQSISRATFRTI